MKLRDQRTKKRNREGYLVKTNFKYQTKKKSIENSGELILSKDNKTWTTLVNAKEEFTNLGKIVDAKKDSLHMKYTVVDSNKTPNGVISTPEFLSKLGEEALIEVGSDKETISLKMLATKTSYSINFIQKCVTLLSMTRLDCHA